MQPAVRPVAELPHQRAALVQYAQRGPLRIAVLGVQHQHVRLVVAEAAEVERGVRAVQHLGPVRAGPQQVDVRTAVRGGDPGDGQARGADGQALGGAGRDAGQGGDGGTAAQRGPHPGAVLGAVLVVVPPQPASGRVEQAEFDTVRGVGELADPSAGPVPEVELRGAGGVAPQRADLGPQPAPEGELDGGCGAPVHRSRLRLERRSIESHQAIMQMTDRPRKSEYPIRATGQRAKFPRRRPCVLCIPFPFLRAGPRTSERSQSMQLTDLQRLRQHARLAPTEDTEHDSRRRAGIDRETGRRATQGRLPMPSGRISPYSTRLTQGDLTCPPQFFPAR